MITPRQKITPFLWFDGQAEEAAKFYTSIFKNSKITGQTLYLEDTPGLAGTVMTVDFELEGLEFTALNGGPHFKFTEAISFVVNCETQKEVDYYWEKLSRGGKKVQCGWLTDKYGVTWQIVPTILIKYLQDKDTRKSHRVMQAMLKMVKLEIKLLKQAYTAKDKPAKAVKPKTK